MHPHLNTAIRAARRAATVIMRHADRLDRLSVETKGRNDFVSEVDRLAEEEIIRCIRSAYPAHAILAEESGASGTPDAQTHQWLIDPLDGTTNYLHGFPHYAVSIAVRRGNQLEQAVVFDPVRNELFTASRGRGAQLNDRRIRVSGVSHLGDALLATGFPFRELDRLEVWLATFRALLPRTTGIRRAGSAALDLAYVAAGRFEGFWEFGLNPWDMAAGALLIEEAGGMVGDMRGGRDYLETGDILTANPDLYADVLRIVKDELPRATAT
jgi:myo-inositol-1(or 4)-monophosphatase